MDRRRHWQQVYKTRAEGKPSWYQRHPSLSLELIQAAGAALSDRILDVGGALQQFMCARFVRVAGAADRDGLHAEVKT